MTMTATSRPRAAALPREVAMRLAAAELSALRAAAPGAAPRGLDQADRVPRLGCPGDRCARARDGRNGRIDW